MIDHHKGYGIEQVASFRGNGGNQNLTFKLRDLVGFLRSPGA